MLYSYSTSTYEGVATTHSSACLFVAVFYLSSKSQCMFKKGVYLRACLFIFFFFSRLSSPVEDFIGTDMFLAARLDRLDGPPLYAFHTMRCIQIQLAQL